MNKYGSVIKELKLQESLQNEQFPKSVTRSTHVLSLTIQKNVIRISAVEMITTEMENKTTTMIIIWMNQSQHYRLLS